MDLLRKLGSLTAGFVLGILIVLASAWGALAIYYSDLDNANLQLILASGFVLLGLVVLFFVASRKRAGKAIVIFVCLFALVVGWWSTIKPSNDRDWKPEVARLARAEIQDNLVTVRNIRNFDYRTESDFTPAYYDKTFDLDKLEAVDLVAVYWMGPAIAHTFVSFAFSDGKHLAVSIETRTEKQEGYSTIKGFFKQFELYYVVADERDVIRLRTNYRKDPPEDVYVYRLQAPLENGRRLFMEYLQRINKLNDEPEFYNTLADNCTTGIWMNARMNPGHVPFSWKILASGYVPSYLYDVGKLDNSLPFSELQKKSHINPQAQSADQAENFSQLIRVGLPGMPQEK